MKNTNKLSLKECEVMVKSGVSLKVIHTLHGRTITCPECIKIDMNKSKK